MCNFNEYELKLIEFDYAKVNIKPDQVKLIQDMSRDLLKLISIPPLALKGIIYGALADWQLKNNALISDLAKESLSKKILAVKEIYILVKQRLCGTLQDPKQKCELLLEVSCERAFKMYIEHLNRHNRR